MSLTSRHVQHFQCVFSLSKVRMPWLFTTEHVQQQLAVNKVYIVCLLIKWWNLRSIHKNPSKTFMPVRRKKCFNIAWSSPPNSSFEAASWHHLWDPPMQNNESVEQGQAGDEESRLAKLKKDEKGANHSNFCFTISPYSWCVLITSASPKTSQSSIVSIVFCPPVRQGFHRSWWTYCSWCRSMNIFQAGAVRMFANWIHLIRGRSVKNARRMLKITHESTRNASSKGHAGHAAHPMTVPPSLFRRTLSPASFAAAPTKDWGSTWCLSPPTGKHTQYL